MVMGGSPCGVAAKELDYDLDGSKFERRSFYYSYFRRNAIGKVIIPPNPRTSQFFSQV